MKHDTETALQCDTVISYGIYATQLVIRNPHLIRSELLLCAIEPLQLIILAGLTKLINLWGHPIFYVPS